MFFYLFSKLIYRQCYSSNYSYSKKAISLLAGASEVLKYIGNNFIRLLEEIGCILDIISLNTLQLASSLISKGISRSKMLKSNNLDSKY